MFRGCPGTGLLWYVTFSSLVALELQGFLRWGVSKSSLSKKVKPRGDAHANHLASGYVPQWHHIYARNLLRSPGVPDDDIHALANITVLNERTNVQKLAGRPSWQHLPWWNLSRGRLDEHLIPAEFADGAGSASLLKGTWGADGACGQVSRVHPPQGRAPGANRRRSWPRSDGCSCTAAV